MCFGLWTTSEDPPHLGGWRVVASPSHLAEKTERRPAPPAQRARRRRVPGFRCRRPAAPPARFHESVAASTCSSRPAPSSSASLRMTAALLQRPSGDGVSCRGRGGELSHAPRDLALRWCQACLPGDELPGRANIPRCRHRLPTSRPNECSSAPPAPLHLPPAAGVALSLPQSCTYSTPNSIACSALWNSLPRYAACSSLDTGTGSAFSSTSTAISFAVRPLRRCGAGGWFQRWVGRRYVENGGSGVWALAAERGCVCGDRACSGLEAGARICRRRV